MIFQLAQMGSPFVSIFFIFLFLPTTMAIYYYVNDQRKEAALFAISIGFLLLIDPQQCLLLLLMVLLNYLICNQLGKVHEGSVVARGSIFVTGIVLNVSAWIFMGISGQLHPSLITVGGGVVSFLAVDTLLAVYRRTLSRMPSIREYFVYHLFFPRLFVGPFESLEDFFDGKVEPKERMESVYTGVGKFLRGAFQFGFVGRRLLMVALSIGELTTREITRVSSWTMVLTLGLGVYHTLAGLSTTVEGIGALFGFSLHTGWGFPFSATSMNDYSKKFLGSLRGHLKRNLFDPITSSNDSMVVEGGGILLVGAIIGLWVNFSTPFLLWGVFLAFFVALEQLFFGHWLKKTAGWFSHLYTVIIAVASFALLAGGIQQWDDTFLKGLFSSKAVMWNEQIVYLLSSYLFLLILGVVLSIGGLSNILEWLKKTIPVPMKIVEAIGDVILFVLLIATIL